MLVGRAIFEDLISATTSARDRHGNDDPAAQILASTAAFHGWAPAQPAEFGDDWPRLRALVDIEMNR